MRFRQIQLALREKLSPPLRIGIRTQLTALVCIVALVSLIILAITTGVYFTSNYRNLRSDRLLMAAQLKSSQVDQSLNYLYYQCYWLSSRDTIQTALANYVSGNKTYENWLDATSVIQRFLASSALFSVVRVYDAGFNAVLNSTNNGTGDLLPVDILNELLPLSSDIALPSSLETQGMLTDPALNDTTYVMSMSLPIYANPSIILSEPRVYGYITLIMSADSIKSVYSLNATTGLDLTNFLLVSAVYNSSERLNGYRFVFPSEGLSSQILHQVFEIDNDTFLNPALREGDSGSVTHEEFLGGSYAIGYSPSSFMFVNWISIVLQSEAVFMEPSTRLAKIISGTVVAIGVFVCMVTLPLTRWAVQPIVRLQAATELITEGRGLRSSTPGGSVSRSSSFIHRRPSRTSSLHSLTFNEKGGTIDGSGRYSGSYAADGSLNHDKVAQNSTGSSINDGSSNRSKKLTTSANLIEARVPVYRRVFSDELSELTDTFNTMTDALDQHYALLEDRVRARTRQLEAAKIEAEKANEAKTVFIANISHELRTPLNGILGMTAISMEERDIDKVQNSLKLIFRSGELLLHILTELLTFSKNVLQRTKLEKRDFNITDVALQIKSIFGKVAKDQGVKLSIIMSPNMIRRMILYGDSNRIIQIVMNLVSNALKFTPVDGKVNVRIKLMGEYDLKKSTEGDHRIVHIIEDTQPADDMPQTPGHKPDDEANLSDKTIDATLSANTDETDDGHSDYKIEKPDDYDSSSLISISTSSYDDTIFHSQFKKTTCTLEAENGEALENPKTWVISIEVEDTGPGIDPSLQESVFEPFVQGDQALSRQYGGTGLGLSICRQLATMMNGTMKLDSTLGVGSKFTFTVPLIQTREITVDTDNPFEDEFNPRSKKNRKVKFKLAKSVRSKSSLVNSSPKAASNVKNLVEKHSDMTKNNGSSQSLSSVPLDRPFLQSTGTALSSKAHENQSAVSKPFKILVAEDNHVNQEVIRRMLVFENIGTIDLACDGQDAFENVQALQKKNEHYDLIFMDVQMPRVDGLSATKMIRGDLNYKYPIVALTAFADESNIKVCLEAGMDGFLSKPIKRPKLRTILEEYCPEYSTNKAEDKT